MGSRNQYTDKDQFTNTTRVDDLWESLEGSLSPAGSSEPGKTGLLSPTATTYVDTLEEAPSTLPQNKNPSTQPVGVSAPAKIGNANNVTVETRETRILCEQEFSSLLRSFNTIDQQEQNPLVRQATDKKGTYSVDPALGQTKAIRQKSSLSNDAPKTIFEATLSNARPLQFEPQEADPNFTPTDAPPGSLEKIEVLASRLALGLPLWHKDDRVDYSGITGAPLPDER
ncbi:MAG: hypothetical protein ACK5GN_09350 [Pseudomonadota bacterium]|jgi:hypothetical protein